MNANVLTAANYAVAGGVGVGAAVLASKVAPDSIAPDSSGGDKAWMIAGGVGGVIAATQVLPRVTMSEADKALQAFHKFDAVAMKALRSKNLPITEVPGVMSTYLGHHNKVESLHLLAAGNGAAGGWATKAKFAGIAAAGAAVGVGLLVGGQTIVDKFSD